MDRYGQFLQLINDAMAEINQERKPGEAIGQSAETVLVGPSANLDSLSFVNFVATLEEKIEHMFGRQLSLIDFMVNDGNREWTVTALAARLAEMVPSVPASKPVVPGSALA